MRRVWNVIRTVFMYVFKFLGAFLRAISPKSAYENRDDTYGAYDKYNYNQSSDKD